METAKKTFTSGILLILANKGAEFLYEFSSFMFTDLLILVSLLLCCIYLMMGIIETYKKEKASKKQ